MNGDVPFEEVFETRLLIVKPHVSDLAQVAAKYIDTITPYAFETIQKLKKGGAKVWLLSGGYDEAIIPLADYLGIGRDHVLANHLEFDAQGVYRDFDRTNPLCKKFGKRQIVEMLKGDGTIQGKVAIVGDGMSEMETKGIVDVCIGFGGHIIRENVKNMADIFVADKTFQALEPILFDL
jgi:phosphoserine phosphatase